MRIPSGVTDQYVYFVATLAGSRVTGLSSFTVYRSRNGAASAVMTTPLISETDSTNMPGVYELLLDEDMTIGSGNDSEEMIFHISEAGMDDVSRTIELYRPKITAGNTLGVETDGDLTKVNLCATTTANSDMRGTDSAALASVCTESRLAELDAANLPADIASIQTDTTLIVADTNELQTDWTNGGRLDLIIDAVLVDTASLNDTKIPQTLNLTASGNIGIDWANVENPTTALDLSATDIQLCDTVTTNTDNVSVSDILTTQMTEAYAVDGTAPTLAQGIFAIQQFLQERSTSSTTVTVKKIDGSTGAMTFTLDDATSPTSITRST
ncbi:MAG TPA: hypothetical protein DHN29_03280 [Cytophagales bacterium]|nr:hypothetical protein [Cytophagales bacterium]|tara:strand:- start:937 stop:1914 length:978 start_codon:yes stop_codon:yes gene_type:complete